MDELRVTWEAEFSGKLLALLRRENPTLADRIRQGGWTM